jgi:hypothetical protein
LKETRLYIAANRPKAPSRPDICSLDSRTVLQHSEQREHGALRKIGVLEKPARIAYHHTELQHDRLQIRHDPREAGSLHRGEERLRASLPGLLLHMMASSKALVKTERGARATAMTRLNQWCAHRQHQSEKN